jgi:DNA topoisomerase-1
VSLKEDDPYDVTLERALEVIRLKQEADANRIITDFADHGIQVLNGRYGPYVTDGKKNAKIPKDREPKSLTLEECRTLIEQAPERGTGRFGRGKRAKGNGEAAAASQPKVKGRKKTAQAAPQGKEPAPRRRRAATATAPAGAGARRKSAAGAHARGTSTTNAARDAVKAGALPATRKAAPGRARKSTAAGKPEEATTGRVRGVK